MFNNHCSGDPGFLAPEAHLCRPQLQPFLVFAPLRILFITTLSPPSLVSPNSSLSYTDGLRWKSGCGDTIYHLPRLFCFGLFLGSGAMSCSSCRGIQLVDRQNKCNWGSDRVAH